MPVYLCKPGWAASEPWRHGVQVYASPFPIDASLIAAAAANSRAATAVQPRATTRNTDDDAGGEEEESLRNRRDSAASAYAAGSMIRGENGSSSTAQLFGVAIRRVRHAELVLVDEVLVAFGRYWLRLRWPGSKGGLAGFIALGIVMSHHHHTRSEIATNDYRTNVRTGMSVSDDTTRPSCSLRDLAPHEPQSMAEQDEEPELSHNNVDREESKEAALSNENTYRLPGDRLGIIFNHESESVGSSRRSSNANDPPNITGTVYPLPPRCESTGLYYPSSSAMELLVTYDDGLSSQGFIGISSFDNSDDGEPLSCRICREGLHDISYDTGVESKPIAICSPPPQSHAGVAGDVNDSRREPPENHAANHRGDETPVSANPTGGVMAPITATPAIVMHHPYKQNPLLAPCECSGSMAFVHYLCVEQWRCQSRHPAARGGLNCETCGGAYTLPPPPIRPVSRGGSEVAGILGEDHWLDAMPLHVLAALRHPHPWWQISAAIVRRRWLRPVAPVIMSPIVALYCHARRTLRKSGVIRRKWACSLCRRRARWKCVRCLRSYYCSRQCQNVSWQIVHKHVCYKPVRFWWSTVVYGVGLVAAFPGMLRDPLIYTLGLSLLFCSFLITGIIGGGTATVLKKGAGIDIRGRVLELSVVILTIILAWISWGLVWAYFGDTSQCWGVASWIPGRNKWLGFAAKESIIASVDAGPIIKSLHTFLFRPAKLAFRMIDRQLMKTGPVIARWICSKKKSADTGFSCLQILRNANPDFFLEKYDGIKCGSDLNTVSSVWILSGFVLLAGTLFKQRERNRRGARQRPHQD